jgi:hypothetical protein
MILPNLFNHNQQLLLFLQLTHLAIQLLMKRLFAYPQ